MSNEMAFDFAPLPSQVTKRRFVLIQKTLFKVKQFSILLWTLLLNGIPSRLRIIRRSFYHWIKFPLTPIVKIMTLYFTNLRFFLLLGGKIFLLLRN